MKGIAKTPIKRDARTSHQPPLFIGIGGSAGGLAAYASFLAQLPVDSGFSFILAEHPDPQHTDNLAELLQSHTSMPIKMAMDGAAVAANQIYLIPQGASLTITSGCLEVESSNSDAMTFRETGQGETGPADTSVLAGSESGHQQLEPELRQTKAQLQSTINKLTQNAADAETAAKDVQTIKAELQGRNEELTRLNAELTNLMNSSGVAAVLIDQNFCIKNFTPAAINIFPLGAGDIGRPLGQVVSQLIDVDLLNDVKSVQAAGKMLERQVGLKSANETVPLLMRIRPNQTFDGRADGLVITFSDIKGDPLERSDRARFAAQMRASGDAVIGLNLDGIIDTWSPGAEKLFLYRPADIIGRKASVLVPAGYEAEHERIMERLRLGEDIAPVDTLRQRKDGSPLYVGVTAAPVVSPLNVPIGIAMTMRDISERKKSEAHKLLLYRELSHRVKNSLAVIQSIARHSLLSTPDSGAFALAFEGRLQALASAHNILTETHWAGADLSTLAQGQLAPFMVEGPSRFKYDGPKLLLAPDVATNLGLVLHELATNANKFGALSVATGLVSLSWSINDDRPPLLHLVWSESGGPPVNPPKRRGFGTELICRAGLRSEQTFAPSGLICDLVLAHLAVPAASGG